MQLDPKQRKGEEEETQPCWRPQVRAGTSKKNEGPKLSSVCAWEGLLEAEKLTSAFFWGWRLQ
jgi:hypothetical protein